MLQLDFGGCCEQLVMKKSSSFKWRITSRKYGFPTNDKTETPKACPHIRQETTNRNNYRSGKQFQNENYLVMFEKTVGIGGEYEPIDLVAGHILGQSTFLLLPT
jgi:hypothetical protein